MTHRNDLRAEIEIDADPATVWGVLSDLEAYPEWNPFIDPIEGEMTVGARLRMRIHPPRPHDIGLKPRVTVAEPERAFGWLGTLGIPHLFDGAHRFELETIAGGTRTRFVQSEHFRGVLLPLVRRWVLPSTLKGFEAMNTALAARAEARKGVII
jgi:hypothetical protein